MKIYVAGKNLERAEKVISQLRASGYEITYDWVAGWKKDKKLYPEGNTELREQKIAENERQGVQNADALVYLWEPDQESARYEAGMAMGLNKPVVAVVNEKYEKPFFFGLPNIKIVKSDEEILGVLKNM